jgi:hypothetical protein
MPWNRRQVLKTGLASLGSGIGLSGLGAGLYQLQGCQAAAVAVPPLPPNTPGAGNGDELPHLAGGWGF